MAVPLNRLPQPVDNYAEKLANISKDGKTLTPEQINRFLSLKDVNNKKITDSKHLIYQLLIQGLEYIDNFDYYLDVIDITGTFESKIFNQLSFARQKNNYDGDVDRQRRNTTVITGIVDCPRCESKLTTSIELQTKSGDEPMTLFSKCFNCDKRWHT